MITALLIIISLFAIYLINTSILNSEKRKFPQKTLDENSQAIQSRTTIFGVVGLVVIIFGTIFLNVFYKTNEEKKIESNKLFSMKKEKEKNDKLQSIILNRDALNRSLGLTSEEVEILNQHQMKVNNLSDEVQNAYKILKSNYYFVDTEKIRFTGLAKKTKGTEYEQKILKTKDSLFLNSHKIAQRQIRDSDQKMNKDESESRKKYGEDFKNQLLDRNLNIKVSVFGKDNKKIKLTYVLFDEVWFRKFETEGYFDKLHSEGFDYIELTDGYDYGQYMKY